MPEFLLNYLHCLPLEDARALYEWIGKDGAVDEIVVILKDVIDRRVIREITTKLYLHGGK